MAGVVFIILFLVIGAIVLIPRYLKSREREAMQATLRAAIERGQTLSPELMASLTQDMPAPVAPSATYSSPVRVKPTASPQSDLRRGIIWLAVAIGIAVLSYMISWDEGDAIYVGIGLASIPGLIGLAFLGFAAVNMSAAKRDKTPA